MAIDSWRQHLAPAVLAAGTVAALGPWAIAGLRRQGGEPADTRVPELAAAQRRKAGTPTMGGLWVLPSLAAALLLTGWAAEPTVCVGLLLMTGLALVGAWDDRKKLRERQGISPRQKLAAQAAVILPVAWWLSMGGSSAAAPSAGSTWGPVGSMLGATMVLMATSNAVNLTDGLDGLAAGLLALALAAYCIAEPLGRLCGLASTVPAPLSAGIALASAGMGASAAFLLFNRHPAQVFMGNVGALALGGLLGFVGWVLYAKWTLALAGGVFVVEVASVVLQTGWFRLRGRRLFRCAPIHHHFQLAGWSETQVVHRFWLAGVVCLLAALGVTLADKSLANSETASLPSLRTSGPVTGDPADGKISHGPATIRLAARPGRAASGVIYDDRDKSGAP